MDVPGKVKRVLVGANGMAVGQYVANEKPPTFRAWRPVCSEDRLRKLGVVHCDQCSKKKRKCFCPPIAASETDLTIWWSEGHRQTMVKRKEQ